MKKKTVKIVGYCSKWEEGIGWVVNIPLDELEEIVAREKNKQERKLLGYCERCGEAVYSDERYEEEDGVYYCDQCIWEIENGYGY